MGAKAHGKKAFMFVLVTVLIDMIGFGLIMPVLPELIIELTDSSVANAALWGGALASIYALMNFLFGPILGNLSDRFGRRPVLLMSMASLGVDFLIMALSQNIWMLFLGRLLAGISGATFSTANAYIADTTEPEDRGGAFGMIGAAFGLGFILGPVLGGLLGDIDNRLPFFVAAGLSALNVLYGLFVLPESLAPENRRSFSLARANPFGAIKHFSKLPHIYWLLIAIFMYALAHGVFPAIWNYFGIAKFDWSPKEVGLSLGLVGVSAFFVQGGLTGHAIKRFGEETTAKFALAVNYLGMIGLALAGQPWMAYVLIVGFGFSGMFNPSIQAIMSQRTPKDAQGELQGATASLMSLAHMITPIIMTFTFFQFTKEDSQIYLPGAPFLLAAAIAGLAYFPLVWGLKKSRAHAAKAVPL